MFGRKAQRIRELEAENADLQREIRELKAVLKSTMKEPPKKSTFREGQGIDAVRKTLDRMHTKITKKKKPSVIIGRRSESRSETPSDDGSGFGTGLVTGIVLSNILSDDDHHSSKEDSFSGGGGEFGGAGASGGWGGSGGGGDE